jgi:hypothetical protein
VCLSDDPIVECETCCCTSSENVEFYDPANPEPECTAPPALYGIDFVFTWSDTCHPDYYFDASHWEAILALSHNTNYRLWDACAADVSPGLIQAAQTGSLSVLVNEVISALRADNVLDGCENTSFVNAFGTSQGNIIVDKSHQWVSTFARLVPSNDQFVGVADLRLCNGSTWKETVKVCYELFSTTTGVGGPNERNSVQANNCSFGYVEFSLKEVQVST